MISRYQLPCHLCAVSIDKMSAKLKIVVHYGHRYDYWYRQGLMCCEIEMFI